MKKIFKSGDYVAIHNDPVWKDKSNFIIRVYLGEKDGRNEWEQLWALRLDENRFSICCIPFFTFNIALGDEIETTSDFIFDRVVTCSGHKTFRVWFGETSSEIKDEVVNELSAFAHEQEWSSKNLLGISVQGDINAKKIANYLQTQSDKRRLIYETGQ